MHFGSSLGPRPGVKSKFIALKILPIKVVWYDLLILVYMYLILISYHLKIVGRYVAEWVMEWVENLTFAYKVDDWVKKRSKICLRNNV